MKIAHLILVHKNPQQLLRQVEAMDHPDFDFYIHVDKKTDIHRFLEVINKKNIFFIKNRTKIFWAGYGTIQATINGFREITLENYVYVNVISGQDFPIVPADTIYNYFISRLGSEFITCESIEGSWKEAASRVTRYHLINWKIPGKFRLEKIVNKILPPRKFPLDYKFVGRANWFTLTPAAITYSLDFLDKHPAVVRYFKYCWGADEFIFSTILYHSVFKEKIRENVVYVFWPEKHQGHPKVLRSEDFANITHSGKLFARKMDMAVDEEIFNLLEKHIQKESIIASS
jgi:hypothetical protein